MHIEPGIVFVLPLQSVPRDILFWVLLIVPGFLAVMIAVSLVGWLRENVSDLLLTIWCVISSIFVLTIFVIIYERIFNGDSNGLLTDPADVLLDPSLQIDLIATLFTISILLGVIYTIIILVEVPRYLRSVLWRFRTVRWTPQSPWISQMHNAIRLQVFTTNNRFYGYVREWDDVGENPSLRLNQPRQYHDENEEWEPFTDSWQIDGSSLLISGREIEYLYSYPVPAWIKRIPLVNEHRIQIEQSSDFKYFNENLQDSSFKIQDAVQFRIRYKNNNKSQYILIPESIDDEEATRTRSILLATIRPNDQIRIGTIHVNEGHTKLKIASKEESEGGFQELDIKEGAQTAPRTTRSAFRWMLYAFHDLQDAPRFDKVLPRKRSDIIPRLIIESDMVPRLGVEGHLQGRWRKRIYEFILGDSTLPAPFDPDEFLKDDNPLKSITSNWPEEAKEEPGDVTDRTEE